MAYQEDFQGAHAQLADAEHLIGYVVEDGAEEKIGTVKAIWEDHTGQPAYLGVATGWLGLGRIHVVPVDLATVSEQGHRIRLPFGSDLIKAAPDFDADYEITPDGEASIRDYYREQSARTAKADEGNPDPGDPSLYTGRDTARDRRDWSPRTDAPMAYGEAIGGDEGLAARDTSLADAETIEEEPEVRDEDRSDAGRGDRRGLGERIRDALPGHGNDREPIAKGKDSGFGQRLPTDSIPLKEETLEVGKREVEAGGLRLRKVIRTEVVQRPVELKREEIEVERVPAHGAASPADLGEDEVFIPLRKEVPEVSKRAQVREELKLNKKVETDRDQVREEIRKEDIDIDREDRPLR